MLPYSGGDVVIYGQSISSEAGLDQVRPLMGVCPQFDVLWGELTGLEHLWIYGHIKGLPFTQVRCDHGFPLHSSQPGTQDKTHMQNAQCRNEERCCLHHG
jgi:hypothetical protein